MSQYTGERPRHKKKNTSKSSFTLENVTDRIGKAQESLRQNFRHLTLLSELFPGIEELKRALALNRQIKSILRDLDTDVDYSLSKKETQATLEETVE